METTSLQQSAYSFPMADDNMEISLEHGHDEDVDIDFDFTTDHHDEDHILEDVGHETMENDAPQSFTYDQEMADEDSHSYHMDDIDLVNDHGSANGDVETLSYGGDTSIQAEGYTSDLGTKVDGLNYDQILDMDFPETTGQETSFEQNDMPENEIQHPGEAEDGLLEGEESGEVGQEDAGSSRVDQHSETLAVVVEDPRSPGSGHNPDAANEEEAAHFVEHKQETAADEIAHADAEIAADLETSLATTNSVVAPDVVVSWDGKDYPLFPTSASDDPDSYFLSDITILDQSLGKFFEAIRSVLQAGLGEEDELVLCIDDLGLEAAEAGDIGSQVVMSQPTDSTPTSSSAQSVSLSQLFSLRQQLLQNGGNGDQEHKEEFWNQFYISISVKKSFSSRLSNLIKGAAEGKGLSDFWEEQTHSLLEFKEDIEQAFDHDSSPESLPSDNAIDELENAQHEEVDEIEGEVQIGQVSSDQEHGSLPLTTTIADDLASGLPSNQESNENENVSVQPEVNPSLQTVVFDGEDDLLDYSEDELGFEDETVDLAKPEATHPISTEDDEYVQQNQPPVSRRSSEEHDAQRVDQTNVDATIETADEVTRDDFEHEDFEEKTAHADQEAADASEYNPETNAQTFEQGEEEISTTDYEAELNGDGTLIYENADFINNDGPELADQFEQEDALTTELDANNERHCEQSAQISTNDSTHQAQPTNEDDNLDPATRSNPGSVVNLETAESSVTLGADEISYDEDDEDDEEPLDVSAAFGVKSLDSGLDSMPFLEAEEEIGYEDDEEEDAEKVETTRPVDSPLKVTELSPNGKRSIAEVDSDDVLDTRTNSTKRPRP